MAEIRSRLVIDPSGALKTFEEVVATMSRQAGAAPLAQNTIDNLQRGLQSLRAELNRTEIGTKRFNQLRQVIIRTETEIKRLERTATSGAIAFDDLATKIGFRLQGFQNMFNVLSGFVGGFIRESNVGEAATAKLTQADFIIPSEWQA